MNGFEGRVLYSFCNIFSKMVLIRTDQQLGAEGALCAMCSCYPQLREEEMGHGQIGKLK